MTAPEHNGKLYEFAIGAEVDAWIVTPPGHDPAGSYPALLMIHGGPFTQYGNRFFDEANIRASVPALEPGTTAALKSFLAPEASTRATASSSRAAVARAVEPRVEIADLVDRVPVAGVVVDELVQEADRVLELPGLLGLVGVLHRDLPDDISTGHCCELPE